MERLLSELRRLFLQPAGPESLPETAPGQAAPPQPSPGTPEATARPSLDAQGRTRLMVLGFHGVPQRQGAAHCSAMLQLGRALMEELGLPEPAFSVNGREGFDLWLPLAQPVPAGEAGEFLGLLKETWLQGLPALNLWPAPGQPALAGTAGPALPPALHPATGLWSVFITPGLAASFTEEAGLDLAPHPDKQADLLARLEPAAPELFGQALETLRQRRGGAAQAAAAPMSATPTLPRPAEPPSAVAALPSSVMPGDAAPALLPGALAGRRGELLRALIDAAPAVVDTPFPALTRLLHGGFRAGRLYALLAPPKSGKTTLAAMWLDHAAANGHPALYVGREMAREQLVRAALARRLRLEASRIEARTLDGDETARVRAALDAYLAREGQHLEIREAGPDSGLADIAAWVRAATAARPGRTPLVVIDPLPAAEAGQPESSAPGCAAALATACKHLARSSGAAVVALHALRRPPEREDELEATPETDALLSAADGVLALQARRPALQDAGFPDETGPARVRLQLLAHRGRIGELRLNHWRAFHLLEEAKREREA